MNNCSRLLLISTLFPGLLLLNAQDRTTAGVAGTVVDAVTRLPVTGATVDLYWLNATGEAANGLQSTTSGPKGEYEFHDVQPGRCAISIKRTGYATLDSAAEGRKSSFVLSAGESARRDYDLMPAAGISGRLTDYDSGEPVLGLRVTAFHEDYFAGNRRWVPAGAGISDPRGNFAIPNLAPGAYRIEIAPISRVEITPASPEAAPQPSYGHSYYPGVPSLETASPVPIAGGQTERLDVRLRKRTIGRVTGTVKVPGAAGNVNVSLLVQQNSPGFYRDVAIGLMKPGPFEIPSLEEGEYVVVATSSGPQRFFAERHLSMGAGDIDDFDLVLEPGITVEGSVRLAEGEEGPIPAGIWVGLEPVEAARTEKDRNVAVGATGEFRLEGRRPGEYWPFLFRLPARYQVADIRYGGSSVMGKPIVPGAAVGAGKLEFLITSRLGSVLGSVRDAEGNAVPDATVVLLRLPIGEKLSPYETRTAISAGQGDFSFTNIPPGKYKAVALLGADARRYRDAGLLRQKGSQSPVLQVEAGSVAKAAIQP